MQNDIYDRYEESKKNVFSSGNPRLQNFLKLRNNANERESILKDATPVDLKDFYSNPLLMEVQKKSN